MSNDFINKKKRKNNKKSKLFLKKYVDMHLIKLKKYTIFISCFDPELS